MTVPPQVNGIAEEKGKILIVGATGFIGQFITQAAIDAGRLTFLLTRSLPKCPTKQNALKCFEEQGCIVLHGSITDQELTEKILREYQIDTVISAVGGGSLLDQLPLIRAIKAVGTVKRFLPSEFGHDVDRADPVEPGLTMYNEKKKVRRVIEELGIPYTNICCNSVASWPYYDNTHPSEVLPPLDKFQIYGDGNIKAYFVAGSDIGKFTIRTAEDVRTVNKNVHFRPSCNLLNINELACLWEKKIGRVLPRVFLSEDVLLAAAKEKIIPQSVVASFTHDIFFKGCQINFTTDGPNDLEVNSLYPEQSFITMDECFDDFVMEIKKNMNPNHQIDQMAAATTTTTTTNHQMVDVLSNLPKIPGVMNCAS